MALGSGARNAQLPPPFRAPNDFFKYTTEELLSLATQYTTSKEAVRPLPVRGGREVVPSSSSKVAPSSIIIQVAKKDIKGGKKRQKRYDFLPLRRCDHDSL
jgi:hypothetical protein